MQVLILNSGIGSRMRNLTKNKPKCLIKINEQDTILDWQIKGLIKENLTDIIITTGPFENKIKDHLKINYPEVDFQYIHNPLYESTNYIYSMFLAKEFLHEDVILMHGDLVFDYYLLKKLVSSKAPNGALIKAEGILPKKDFKARIISNSVLEIGINVFGKDCYFLLPIYKLSRSLWEKWFKKIEEFISKGKYSEYAEGALNLVLKKNILSPVYFQDEFCSEIDDEKDLKKIKKFFN